jgi:hypothetical protein
MNLYITRGDREKLKKAFLNIRKQHIIAVPEIMQQMGYEEGGVDEYSSFLINEEIKNQILAASRAKKSHSIIYSNPHLDDSVIRFIVFFVNQNTDIAHVVFLTEEGADEDYYELFDAVTLYPTIKKVHILECKPIQSTLFSWIHKMTED